LKYRKEIDGLRAFAVLPVILDHAGFSIFSGGFVGVDIFFVISGFLISRIIFDEATDGRFSLINFYERRARRIIPALILVVVLSSIAAYFTMLPDPFENFAQSVVATLLFSNNVLLTLTSGYWELASDFKPLLHTWSLGVEEQFYIFYPILVLVIFKIRRSLLPIALLFGIVASFTMSAVLTPIQPNGSFYLIHTRAWELLLGALASFLMSHISVSQRASHHLSLAGFVMILIAIFGFNEHLTYPGYLAAVPCIGTMLILMFTANGTLVNRILSFRFFVGIGLISYSAYLWHQPFFAFARIVSTTPPKPLLMGALSLLTLGVSYFSWKYVEQPFRSHSNFSRKQVFSYTAIASGTLVILGFGVYRLAGLPERIPGIGLSYGRYIAYNERGFQYKKDAFQEEDKPHLLIVGNSTGRDLVNVILESGRFSDFELIYRDDLSICGNSLLQQQHAQLIMDADAIVAASNWTYDQRCSYIATDSSPLSDKPFVLVGPKHFGYNLNAYMHVPITERPKVRASLLPDTTQSNSMYRQMVPASHFVDLLAAMDKHFGSTPIFDDAGAILSADHVHLTKAGAIYFANFIFDDPTWSSVFSLVESSP
jgi:peptidoglycan/LPS O-acetylase OafA/YrhL